MRDFFGKLFGSAPRPEEMSREMPKQSENRSQDAEVVNLRMHNFRRMLDEASGTKIDDEHFAKAVHELAGDGPFPPLLAEEMRIKVREISEHLFNTDPEIAPPEDYNPADDTYEAMGTRRGTFEKAFAEHIGRAVTGEEMDTARKMFEMDADLQKNWPTMVGEEVANEARLIAERILRYEGREAAK